MANYKVLVPELSVPRSIGVVRDVYGNEAGYNHVNKTWFEGDVLSEDDVSPAVQEAVERGDLEGKLEVVGDDVEAGPATVQPVVGYDDLSVEQVRGLFGVLPSESITKIVAYEREHKNRDEIVLYDIGRGEGYLDRIDGTIGSELDDATEKPVSEHVTREVGEDSVQFGEGTIGDGQPNVEPGTAAAEAKQEDKPKQRRGRKAAKAQEESTKPEGEKQE